MITVAQAIALLQKCNPDAILRIAYSDDSDPVELIEEIVNRKTVYFSTSPIDWEDEENIPIEVTCQTINFRQIKFLQQRFPGVLRYPSCTAVEEDV